MITGKDFLINLFNILLPNREAPVLARVMRAYEGPGKNKYSCDVKVLTAGTLEETDREIAEVPISPVWMGKKKRGLYAIPNEGQVVIVEFLQWNAAFPYIAGFWSDEYEAGEFGKDKFVITDGDGMNFVIDAAGKIITIDNGKLQIILNGDKCSVRNGSKSLFTILDTQFQNIIGMKLVGSPALHTVSPDDIAKFKQGKTDLSQLLEA